MVLYLNIQELALTQKGMLERMKTEQEIRKEHEKRLDELESKPGKDYEKIKWTIVTALISAIVSGLAGWLIGFLIK